MRHVHRLPAPQPPLGGDARRTGRQDARVDPAAYGHSRHRRGHPRLQDRRRLPHPRQRQADGGRPGGGAGSGLAKELLKDGAGNFAYKQLGERLQALLEGKEAEHKSAEKKLRKLERLVGDVTRVKAEPERLDLKPEEYALYQVLQEYATVKDEAVLVRAARGLLARLRQQKCFPAGWSGNDGGCKKVRLALQVATWEEEYESLQLASLEASRDEFPFLQAAVDRLAAVMP